MAGQQYNFYSPETSEGYRRWLRYMESGGDPNARNPMWSAIDGGPHGLYQMTDAAWQDVRALDPSLPADRTQATPEQQERAQGIWEERGVGAINSLYAQNPNIPADGVPPPPTWTQMYLQHLGQGNARKLMTSDVSRPLDALMGNAFVQQNPGLTMNPDGTVRTVGELFAYLDQSQAAYAQPPGPMNSALMGPGAVGAPPPGVPNAAPGPMASALQPPPHPQQRLDAMLAALGPQGATPQTAERSGNRRDNVEIMPWGPAEPLSPMDQLRNLGMGDWFAAAGAFLDPNNGVGKGLQTLGVALDRNARPGYEYIDTGIDGVIGRVNENTGELSTMTWPGAGNDPDNIGGTPYVVTDASGQQVGNAYFDRKTGDIVVNTAEGQMTAADAMAAGYQIHTASYSDPYVEANAKGLGTADAERLTAVYGLAQSAPGTMAVIDQLSEVGLNNANVGPTLMDGFTRWARSRFGDTADTIINGITGGDIDYRDIDQTKQIFAQMSLEFGRQLLKGQGQVSNFEREMVAAAMSGPTNSPETIANVMAALYTGSEYTQDLISAWHNLSPAMQKITSFQEFEYQYQQRTRDYYLQQREAKAQQLLASGGATGVADDAIYSEADRIVGN